MLKQFVIMGALSLSINAGAEVLRSEIHSLYEGKNGEASFVKLINGRVVFLNTEDKLLARELQEHQGKVEIVTDENNELLSISALEDADKFLLPQVEVEERQSYEPTIIKGNAEAKKIFKRLNGKYQRVSQCFNRAHVWSSEEFNNHNLKSLKGWLFFTNAYIVRNRFIWWFHVAPMFRVKEGSKTQDMVMDHRYAHGPQTTEEWKNMFVWNKRKCKLNGKFIEYNEAADQTEDCYWFTTPMYYWQPADIGSEEQGLRVKTEFYARDVKAAYSEAF